MNNTELLEKYRTNRKITDVKFFKQLRNPILFNLYTGLQLPMAFMAGCKVKHVDLEKCEITVPYRWMNQNPFSSTYFAVLAMAAEMSTGLLALIFTRNSIPSVSMLVTHLEADFVKKATGITTFVCTGGKEMNEAVERAILTGEGQTFSATTVGYSANGEIEATFKIEWSFRMRLPKK